MKTNKKEYSPIEGFLHGITYWFLSYTTLMGLFIWMHIIRLSDLVYAFGFGFISLFFFIISMHRVFIREKEDTSNNE